MVWRVNRESLGTAWKAVGTRKGLGGGNPALLHDWKVKQSGDCPGLLNQGCLELGMRIETAAFLHFIRL